VRGKSILYRASFTLLTFSLSLSILCPCTCLASTCVHEYRPKAWWLAHNKFYGLTQAKATPINVLRSKLEDALRNQDGMRIPERILNLEADGNRKYREVSQIVLQETRTAKKGTTKATRGARQTGRNATGGRAALKRDRSPDGSNEGLSSKRIRPDAGSTPFGFLTGVYDLTAPEIREQWEHIEEDFRLVITLDSKKRLYGAFLLGICSGILRSTVNIEPRADGANAKFEWCGREENGESSTYPPEFGMTGTLRFTKQGRDERHTIKGVIDEFPAVGRLEFTGVRISDAVEIAEEWGDYLWELEGYYVLSNRRHRKTTWQTLGYHLD
jgi:hypothetical protein